METEGSYQKWGGRREKRAFFSEDTERRILKTIRGKGGDINAVTTKHVQAFIFRKHGKSVSRDYILKLLKKYGWTKVKRGSVILWLRPIKPEPDVKRGPYTRRQTRIMQLQKYMSEEKSIVVPDELALAFLKRSDWRNLIPKQDYIKYFTSLPCGGLEDEYLDDFEDDDFDDDDEDDDDETFNVYEFAKRLGIIHRSPKEDSNPEVNPET